MIGGINVVYLWEESILNDTSQIEQRVRDLLESQRLAVLATHNRGQPYANLMAFAGTDDLKHCE